LFRQVDLELGETALLGFVKPPHPFETLLSAKPSDSAIFDRADRRVHSLFLEATLFRRFSVKADLFVEA